MGHQKDIIDVLTETGRKETSRIVESKVLCSSLALFVAQIGELLDLLTDSSKERFKLIDSRAIYLIRNRVDHSYATVRPIEIALCALNLSSKEAIEEVRDIRGYCNKNKRTD